MSKNKFGLIIFIFLAFITCTCTFIKVNAASASVSVKTSKSTVVVGGSFNITVTVYSASSIGAWEYNLMYDTTKFQLVSGTPHIADYANGSGKTTATYNYTFRAKSSGSGNIYVQNTAVDDWNENHLSVSNGSTSVKVITQAELEASYSKNNYLKSLSIEGATLSPEFNKDTLEYSVELDPETTNININATKEDSKASISGVGNVAVSEGDNQLKVVVTAENGKERIYIINAKVKELSPINVKIGKEELSVVRKKEVLQEYLPQNYTETTAKIGEEEIPAFISDITKFTLVGLKDKEGKISLYIYDSKKNAYTKYNEISGNKITIYPMKINKSIKISDNYKKYQIKIGDEKYDVYKLSKGSQFSLIYGMNVETGKNGLYIYDSKEESLQRYYTEELDLKDETINTYSMIIMGLGGIVLVLCVILLILCFKIVKNKKKISEKKQNMNSTKKEDIRKLKDKKE